MGRRVLGSVAGIVVCILVITLVEGAGHMLFPPPPGTDMRDPAQVARVVDVIPLPAKVMVAVAWFLGSLAGAATALVTSRWPAAAWIVAAMVIAGAIISYTQIPHPLWMQAAGVLLPLAAAWLALRLVAARTKPAASF